MRASDDGARKLSPAPTALISLTARVQDVIKSETVLISPEITAMISTWPQ
jgi:hypothetical protein